MRILASLGLVLCLAAPAVAEKILLIDGNRVLMIDSDTGTATRLQVDKVIRVGSVPDDPGDPTPPTGLEAKARQLADQVNDPALRPRVAAVYDFTVEALKGGQLKPESAVRFARTSLEAVLGTAAGKWKPFTDGINGELAKLVQDGGMSKERLITAFEQIRDGVEQGGTSATKGDRKAKRKKRREAIQKFLEDRENLDVDGLVKLLLLLLEFLKMIGVFS